MKSSIQSAPSSVRVRETSRCNVCNSPSELAVELPKLPLTGIYSATGMSGEQLAHDQALLVCSKCGHGQLRYVLDGGFLYGASYGFRTSSSATASEGSAFFAAYLAKLFAGRTFERVLEFGCNDTCLLRLISDRANRLVGCDPILAGREADYRTEKISVIGKRVEDIDFRSELGGAPDLVVSQHTMEHLEHPEEVLRGLFKVAGADTVFVLEFPCFDNLIANYRFDQVFHQHLQYFGVRSILTLLRKAGAEVIDYTFNYHYWGAILIAFRKPGAKAAQDGQVPSLAASQVRGRYELFRQAMQTTAKILKDAADGPLFGYGAALMLPVLAYHLNDDFSRFVAVLDDDPSKDGLGYANLPVRISLPRDVDLSAATVCLTAMDNRRPIAKALIAKKPRRIVNPLAVF